MLDELTSTVAMPSAGDPFVAPKYLFIYLLQFQQGYMSETRIE